MRKLRALLALLGLAVIVAGMPALLIAAAPIGAISITWTPEGILRALATPDNGTLAFALFKLVGWLAWAILTASVLLEVAGLIRRAPVPQLPGLAMPQLLARRLVASAAVLFIATSSMTTSGVQTTAAQAAGPPPQHPAPAQTLPDHGLPVQGEKPEGKPRTYTVKKGDTLSEIALEKTGRASNYPKLFKASTHTIQPGGRRLTDPDEIDIGWKITIPTDTTKAKPAKGEQPSRDKPSEEATATAAPRPTPTPSRQPVSSPAPAPSGLRQAPADSQVETAAPVSDSPSWLLTGLAGSGALLAGGLLLTLKRRRAAQFRSRRPGRMITLPAPENAAVEKTLIREGRVTGNVVLFIDEVLRRTTAALTAAKQPVPVLVGVDAHLEHLTVRLGASAEFPPVWECLDPDTRQVWRIAADADLELLGPLKDGGAPPWPQLVTLGRDTAGWRLVNLEAVGVASLTGDPTYCHDLARYLVCELAVSPWARDVDIDCLDICAGLPGLAPDRVRHHTDPAIITDRVGTAVATTDRLAAVQPVTLETARITHPDEDLWESRLLISATTDAEHLPVLTKLLTDQKGRTGTTLILVAPDQPPVGMEIRLTETGRVHVPALELNLVANGLTEDETRGCVALVTAGRDLDGTPMPVVDDPERGDWAALCDEAGAVRDELTVPRGSHVAGATSVLPEPDPVYLTQTANTVEDLAQLTPKIPAEVAARVEIADPTLDADLADWWANSCTRPRLQVLGRIKVRVGTAGDPTKAVSRMPSCTEAVTYLSTRPGGATTQEVADALGIGDDRVRQDLSIVRAWLGKNPATGRPFLPEATKHPQAIERGVGLYLIEDLLCDADLFKRLRLRGETRGADGLKDLYNALKLVKGAPYDGLRTRGGFWLVEQGLDHHLLCSIVDVAHLVSTITLQTGNFDAARNAAELAALAAPTDTTPRLDLAAVAALRGDSSAAAELARSVVAWRDEAGECIDPSRSAEAIIQIHRWLDRTG
jgi:hypothetical protein